MFSVGRGKSDKVIVYKKAKRRRSRGGGHHPFRTALSIIFTFILAGVVGFIGYSIAKPILSLMGEEDEEEEAIVEVATETSRAETTTLQTSERVSMTTAVTTTTTPVVMAYDKAAYLSVDALSSQEALTTAVATIVEDSEVSAVVVPLKVAGGAIYYQTQSELAISCGAVFGTMTLEEIYATVEQAGVVPIAQINLLEDNLLPVVDASAGYTIAESGSRWLDNAAESGGVPWASLFSTLTQTYLVDIATEIADAGFTQIWCDGLVFPAFREEDLAYIGETVQVIGRGAIFGQLMETIADAVPETVVTPVFAGQTLLEGTCEAYTQGDFAQMVVQVSDDVAIEDIEQWAVDEEVSIYLSGKNIKTDMLQSQGTVIGIVKQ